MLNRKVKQIYTIKDGDSPDPLIRSFSSFLRFPNLVLLGDPGAGKSFLFEMACKEESGILQTAREFLIYENKSDPKKTLYIDALDEKRSRTDHPHSIDEIVKRVAKLQPPKLRISCRAADWLGETDLSAFKSYFESSGEYVVVLLLSLTDEEIDQILSEKGIVDSSSFRETAKVKGVDGLLRNPLTLTLLEKSVTSGGWPKTKKELYEKATTYISLQKNSTNIESPPYDQVPYEDDQKVLSALTRTAFSSVGNEAVAYIHRTIAEFLGAKWLAEKVQKGFSFKRLISLIGVGGYPASELRGLHAWLAVFLPEYEEFIINSDPYGVLVYGDSASLHTSARKCLLNALQKLSEKDPWFRSQDWTSEPLGALSGEDMIEVFRHSLLSSKGQFHFRSVILDAIKHGPPLPEMGKELFEIFLDDNAPYVERENAFECIRNTAPEYLPRVVSGVKNDLKGNQSSIRLRAHVIETLYEEYFIPSDVFLVLEETLNLEGDHALGELYTFTNSLPQNALPEILDSLANLKLDENTDYLDRGLHEVEFSFSMMISRTLHSGIKFEVKRLWNWLSSLYNFRRKAGGSSFKREEIKKWLKQNESKVLELFNLAVEELDVSERKWILWHDFKNIVMYQIDASKAGEFLFQLLNIKESFSEKDEFLFELALYLSFTSKPPGELFWSLSNWAVAYPELVKIRDKSCFWEIDDWRLQDRTRRLTKERERLDTKEKNCKDFEENRKEIQNGHHKGWLSWTARVYFALFKDVDKEVAPQSRLTTHLNEEYSQICIDGFKAIIKEDNLPSPNEVVNLYYSNKIRWWWYSIIAGMDENWRDYPTLQAYPEETLRSAIAVDLLYPTYYWEGNNQKQIIHGWLETLITEKPELVQEVYCQIIREGLQGDKDHAKGIYELLSIERLVNSPGKLAMEMLKDFPRTTAHNLKIFLLAALNEPIMHKDLIKLAHSVLKSRSRVSGERRVLWLSIVFLLSFDKCKEGWKKYISGSESALWALRKFINEVQVNSRNIIYTLSLNQFYFLITRFGRKFPNVDRPSEAWGNRNPWDASQFVRHLLDHLSTRTESSVSSLLNKLTIDKSLLSYRDHIKHTFANQSALRRQKEFNQPDWGSTTKALSSGEPAHVADLFALAVDYLKDIRNTIRNGNTDTYKNFWNEDSYGRIVNPKSEESCRDKLIEIIKMNLNNIGVRAEPEAHMVTDKRADIALLLSTQTKLPIEIKRDYHQDLWHACETQLDRLYTRDPESEGYGIYFVFWFGDKRTRNIPSPPRHLTRPKSPQELEESLRSLIPPANCHRLEVIVIDVTPPS